MEASQASLAPDATVQAKAFLARACPSCGKMASIAEVKSDPPAEALSLDQLHPYWSGSLSARVFFSYHRCNACGLLFSDHFFDRERLAELYSALAPNMNIVPTDALRATQRSYFDVAAKGSELTGGYLELGPDIGWIASEAARDGRFDNYWLFEPNKSVHPQLAAACAGAPHNIIADLDDLSPVPDGSIGLAVMIHVLDHMLEPKATLDAIFRKLRPGGRLVIVTHNEASLLRRVMGKRWPPFCLQHPQLFSPSSMTNLLHRTGYAKVRVERSMNYFPIDFIVRQAAQIAGLNARRLPLPRATMGLKLGNIITVAER